MTEPKIVPRKNRNFEYDDVFKHVNPFGSYQKKVVFGSLIILVAQNIQFTHLIFVTGTPNFECATPNVTCGGVNRCCTNCTTYKFDTMFTTMVSEWNLICDRAHISAIIQSMFFVGMLVGSFLSGIVSDAYGRRTVIFCTFGVMAGCGMLQAFAESKTIFGLLRFGNGAFMISTTLSQYILMMEFLSPEYRTMAGNAHNIFWVAGTLVAILIAYFITEWRTYTVFPESPRWLLAHGELEKAHQLIMKFGSKSDKKLDSGVMKSIVDEIRNDQLQREKDEQKRHTPLDLLRTPKLRRWSLIIWFGWFTVSMTYFAILIYVTHLPGNIYSIMAIREVLILVFTFPTWYLMGTIGRRMVHASFMTLTGVILLLILAIPKGNHPMHPNIYSMVNLHGCTRNLFIRAVDCNLDQECGCIHGGSTMEYIPTWGFVFTFQEYEMAITWLAIGGYVLTKMVWSSVYLMTSELFPTVLRNTAQGTGSTAARVGAISAPYFLMLAQLPGSSIHLPMAIFGACAVACGILSLWLPETALSTLHQTIEETEESQESYGMPCMRKRGRKKRQEYTLETVQENLDDLPEDKKECS